MNDKFEVIKILRKKTMVLLERLKLKKLVIIAQLEKFDDEYVLLQMQSSKFVYSYGTALFLHGLSDRTPHIIDITIPQGGNVKVYDKERCICDIVKKKEKIDKQLYIRAIQECFRFV